MSCSDDYFSLVSFNILLLLLQAGLSWSMSSKAAVFTRADNWMLVLIVQAAFV